VITDIVTLASGTECDPCPHHKFVGDYRHWNTCATIQREPTQFVLRLYRAPSVCVAISGIEPHVPTENSNIVAIVDDDGDVRDVLDALLESAGHTVKTYTSGRQLLDDPELGEVTCLVVDQKMPEMTGLDLLRALDAGGHSIPSLLVTGLPDARVAAEARDLGAIDVLSKPIDFEKLLQLVAYAAQ
jgi:CheY-like chemotaxis protein